MNSLAALSPALALPALVAAGDARTQVHFWSFSQTIRNMLTQRAYVRARGEFLGRCEARGVTSLGAVQPLHGAATAR